MKIKLRSLISSLPLLLSMSCTSSPDPKLVSELDALARTPAKTATIPGAANYTAMPIKAGQWVHYLITDKDGHRSSMRQQVWSKGDGPESFWFEMESITPGSRSTTRSLISISEDARQKAKPGRYEYTADQFVKIKRLIDWRQGNSQADELPPVAVQMMGGAIGKISFLSASRIHGQTNTTVKAGTFQRCFQMDSTVTTSFATSGIKGCVHPAVPLSGLVQAEDDKGSKWELIGFGTDAKDSLIKVPVKSSY